MNAGAQVGGHGGEFQADKACADHHHVAYLLHQGGEGIGILLGLDAKYALQLGAGYWQRTVVCAGGQYQVIVDGRLAGGEQDSSVLPVDGSRLVVDQLDALGGEELGWTEQQGVLVDLTEQVGLGQRWALVGQAGLVADQGDASVVSLLAQ
ncbi:hypothetical protein D3C81_1740410 [compost metagenome]